MYQNPWFGRSNSGILVVPMAVVITISSGTAAKLVHSPMSTSRPQTISTEPTKSAVRCGCRKPILANQATPIFGSMNFRMPCVKKISPTGKRIRKMLCSTRNRAQEKSNERGHSIAPYGLYKDFRQAGNGWTAGETVTRLTSSYASRAPSPLPPSGAALVASSPRTRER